MEKEPSSAVSAGQVPERRVGGMPVLQVNVLRGLVNENGMGGTTASLSSTITRTSSLSGFSTTHRATAAAAGSTYTTSTMASTTRRVGDNGVSQYPHAGINAATGTAVNGGGTTTSTLAKPVLDLSQVRCTPMDQWLPDAHVVNCMAPDCSNSFSLFNRKHHCRMCGRVFCSSCYNNVVYIPAAVVHSTTNGASSEGLVGSLAGTGTSSTVTPEPQMFTGYGSGGGDGSSSVVNSARRIQDSPAGVGRSTSPNPAGGGGGGGEAGDCMTSPAATGDGNGNFGNYGTGTSPATAAAPSFAAVPCRVCASCSYEVQLVISTRQENGEPRRRSRGELKMIQRVLLVNIMTFLTLRDLASVALVSADFYFMSRDNLIWYQYNMTRWAQERDVPQLSSLKSRAAAAMRAQQLRGGVGGGGGGGAGGGGGTRNLSMADDIFKSASVIQDATALSESEAAKRVISLHARYNYTQFLDFARRQEMARCEGLSSFSLGARILLGSPIRVALVGPCGIGKTASTHAFLGEKPAQMVVRPTIGFERRAVTVRLARGLSTEVVLHLYDLSGADRYEELRRFVCRHCHVIGLCYDPAQKVTLVQAADIMMELEPALGPQPVVVCGLVRQAHHGGGSGGGGGGSGPSSAHRHPHCAPPTTANAASTVGGGGGGAGPAVNGAGALPINATSPVLTLTTVLRNVGPTSPESSAVTTLAPETDGSAAGGRDPLHSDPLPAAPVSLPPRLAETMCTSALTPPTMPAAVVQNSPSTALEVSVDDAVGITVRGHSSIQCPLLQPTAFFEAVVQSVLDRLAEATVASTTTMSDITAELTMQGAGFPSPSTSSRYGTAPSGAASVPTSAIRGSVVRRRPRASRALVQELLNLTMQPCALDILLDRE